MAKERTSSPPRSAIDCPEISAILDAGRPFTVVRAVWQIAVAGWISAALTVSPVLAAMQCQVCCNIGSLPCSEAAPPPSCCAKHAPSQAAEPRGQCPSCPQCDSQRPNPAVPVSLLDWKPPVAVAVDAWPVQTEWPCDFSLALDSGRLFVDRAMPPPRVMFCTWRK